MFLCIDNFDMYICICPAVTFRELKFIYPAPHSMQEHVIQQRTITPKRSAQSMDGVSA